MVGDAMEPEKKSVAELEAYWEYYDNLKDGDVITQFVHTPAMPSWSKICLSLHWHQNRLGRFREKHHGFCGVYRLVALTNERWWHPARIPRLGGEDDSGTLYIGEAGWLHQRLNQLRRSCTKEDSHGVGKMWRDCDLLRGRFPLNKLGVAILGTSVQMRKKIEYDLIRAYLNSFGDTPPLNCSF
jgi:hypothetical protein